jgi:tetratricopeptide (TPR) repeat protein
MGGIAAMSKKRRLYGYDFAAVGLLTVATVAVYARAVGYGYVNLDDINYVYENPKVLNGLTLEGLRWAFSTGFIANWHPLTWLSLMLDTSIFGESAGARHAVNIALHTLNACLLYTFFRIATQRIALPFFVAAVFALHPWHVESVAWISGRKDVLSGFFFMLTLLAYLRFVRSRTWKSWGWVTALFALGLMAKPILVTLPFVLLLLDLWPLKRLEMQFGVFRPWWLRIYEKGFWFAMAAASCGVTWWMQRLGGATDSVGGYSITNRVMNMCAAYGAYILKTIVPVHLSAFYPHPVATPWITGIAALILLGGVMSLVHTARRNAPWAYIGWFWFLGVLVPVIGLVQVGAQAYADRYMYLPLIGLSLPGALACSINKKARTIGLLCLAFWTPFTWVQVGRWQDNETLFRHAIAVTRDNDLAHYNLGTHYLGLKRFPEAQREFAEAVRIRPAYAEARANLGVALIEQGQYEKAVEEFRKGLDRNPNHANTHANLGVALLRTGRAAEASEHFEQAASLGASDPLIMMNLGEALVRARRNEAAADVLQKVLIANPGLAQANYPLGKAFFGLNRLDDAIAAFNACIAARPGHVAAQVDLGVALGRKGDLDKAEKAFQAALTLSPGMADAEFNLGNIAFMRNQFDVARAHYQAAAEARPKDAEARCALALAFERLGQPDNAAEEYRRVLEINPNHKGAQAALATLGIKP